MRERLRLVKLTDSIELADAVELAEPQTACTISPSGVRTIRMFRSRRHCRANSCNKILPDATLCGPHTGAALVGRHRHLDERHAIAGPRLADCARTPGPTGGSLFALIAHGRGNQRHQIGQGGHGVVRRLVCYETTAILESLKSVCPGLVPLARISLNKRLVGAP